MCIKKGSMEGLIVFWKGFDICGVFEFTVESWDDKAKWGKRTVEKNQYKPKRGPGPIKQPIWCGRGKDQKEEQDSQNADQAEISQRD